MYVILSCVKSRVQYVRSRNINMKLTYTYSRIKHFTLHTYLCITCYNSTTVFLLLLFFFFFIVQQTGWTICGLRPVQLQRFPYPKVTHELTTIIPSRINTYYYSSYIYRQNPLVIILLNYTDKLLRTTLTLILYPSTNFGKSFSENVNRNAAVR